MYWRVRNLTPEHLVRQYGVHAALAVSVLFNVLLILTRPNPASGIIKQHQKTFDQFARQVTSHLLDSSYITYEQSTAALLGSPGAPGELAPNVVQQLRQVELLPRSADEVKATIRQLSEERRVSTVRIDAVVAGEPNAKGLIPIQVRGVAVYHSASGSEDPRPFRFQFLMGLTGQAPDQRPIVAAFQGQ